MAPSAAVAAAEACNLANQTAFSVLVRVELANVYFEITILIHTIYIYIYIYTHTHTHTHIYIKNIYIYISYESEW